MKSAINVLQFFLLLFILSFSNHLNAQCDISNITVETFGCDSGDTFTGEINFDHSGDVGEVFTYSISGQQIGDYPYDALPMVLDIINVSDLEFFTIIISDDTGLGCSNTSEFENPCFENCFIYGITAMPGACNGDDEFELVVDFMHDFSSDFFDLHINYSNGVVIENIPYASLPYTVTGLVEECISDIIVGIYDSADDGCVATKAIGPVCCSFDLCDLSNLVVDLSNCDGTEFAANIDFDYIGSAAEFTYIIYDNIGDVVVDGMYAYADLPLDLSFDNTTSPGLKVVIIDQDDSTCNLNQDFDNPCYEECFIYNLTAIPENCVNGEFLLVVDFQHEFTSGTFDLHITYPNGVLIEDIPYSSLPFTVTGLQEDCTADIEVLVCDSEIGGCLDVIGLAPVCCADFCALSGLIIDVSECIGSEYTVDIDFDYMGNDAEFDYIIYDYQSNPVQNGSYEYANLPLTLAVDNTTSIGHYIVITDQGDQDCIIDEYFDNPCYEQLTVCDIVGIDFNDIPVCDNGIVVAEWFIFAENTSEQGFNILINSGFSISVDYQSSGLYDFVFDAPGTEIFTIQACDIGNPNCCFTNEFPNPCFEEETECELSDLVIENTECNNGQFDLIIDFEYSGTTNDFYDYVVYGSQNEIIEEGFAEFVQLPLSININNTDSEWFYFEINQNDNPVCMIAGELFNPCYEPACNIFSIDFGGNPICENGLIVTQWFIFAENTNEIGYDIFINDEFITFVDYQGDGPYDFEIEAPDMENFSITACDNDNLDCCFTWELDNPCFEENTCNISSVDFNDIPVCEDGLIVTDWLILSENTSEVGFDIFIDGEFQFFIGYESDGLYSLALEAPNTDSALDEVFELTICDNDNADCCMSIDVDNPCYEQDAVCEIVGIDFNDIPVCEDGLVVAEWFILSENTSQEGFNVGINSEFSISVDYQSSGLYDFVFDAPETEFFTIQACDIGNPNCCFTTEFLNPCFEEDTSCELSALVIESTGCDNAQFDLIIDFDYSGTTNSFYDYIVYGSQNEIIEEGFAEFAQLPLSINMANTDSEWFYIEINENDNPDCNIVGEIFNPCFEPPAGDCFIDDVTATVIACEGNGFDMLIDFVYDDASDQFTINGNGNSYGTFLYTDLPITLIGLEADCTTEFEFIVTDVADEDCTAAIDYGTVCCEDFNNFEETTVNYTFNENIINLTIDVSTTLLEGCTLEVFVNDELYTVLTGASTSFELGPFDCGTDQVLVLSIVNTCTDEVMGMDVDLGEIECVTSVQSIDISDFLIWDQNQKQLTIDAESAERFSVQILSSDGRLIQEEMSISHSNIIKLDQENTGIYIVRIEEVNTGRIGSKKIFVY